MNYLDLHCDTATKVPRDQKGLFHHDRQLDPSRLPAGERWAQCYAVFIPDQYRGEEAMRYFLRYADFTRREWERLHDEILPIGGEGSLEAVWQKGKHAGLLTVEGGAVLGGELKNLDVLSRYDVRMMTLTWNAENEIGGGAESSAGLSAFGRELVPLMEEHNIKVDVSHLNDRTFWEVLETAKKPLAASHSNSRALCGVPRNLTDDQFRAIVERGGVVGLNFYNAFLRENAEEAVMDDILRHAEHFLDLGGENTVALGSDFDGAEMPRDLHGVEDVPRLRERMCSAFGKELTEKICYKNALDFLGI